MKRIIIETKELCVACLRHSLSLILLESNSKHNRLLFNKSTFQRFNSRFFFNVSFFLNCKMHNILTDFQCSATFVILNTISLNNCRRLWIVALHHEHFPQAQLYLFVALCSQNNFVNRVYKLFINFDTTTVSYRIISLVF